MKSILPLALISLVLGPNASAVTYTSIEEAVNRGWLRVDIAGRDSENDDPNSEAYEEGWGIHNGKCIKLTATNISGRSLSIMIETGRTLYPTDTGVQTMMVTEQLVFTIPVGSKQEHVLYAMCTEMSDSGPSAEDGFGLGSLADTDLRGMAQLIEKYKAQNETGQDAVWVITDDLDLSSIEGEDADVVSALRKYASEVTGKSLAAPSAPTNAQYNVPLFNGSIEFGYRLTQGAKVSLVVYDPDGNEFRKLLTDKPHEAGIYTIRYSLEASGLAPGVYTVKMFRDGSFASFKQFRIE